MLTGLVIHRMTGCKLVIRYLNRLNHTGPYKQILSQNQAWERMVVSESSPAMTIRSDVPLHSGIDNNDGRQDTLTGYGTTHHTNSLFCQEEVKSESADNSVKYSIAGKHPGTKEITSYRLGVQEVGPPLFPNHVDDNDNSLLEHRFKEDILLSLVGGLPDDVADNLEESLIGSWTAFHRTSTNIEHCKSVMEYLPVVREPPNYDVL